MRCDPRTAVSALRMASLRCAVTGQQFLGESRLRLVIASSTCSVETYSSLNASASLRDFSRSWLTCDDIPAWLRAAARDFRQLFDFLVDLAEDGLRADADFFEDGDDDAFLVFN